MKTADLIPPALDWAVDKAEGHIRPDGGYYCGQHGVSRRYSTDWSQGGPIIEREGIGLDFYEDGGHEHGGEWGAATNEGTVHALGRTPLIAAMRCFVSSRLGDEVKIPKELL